MGTRWLPDRLIGPHGMAYRIALPEDLCFRGRHRLLHLRTPSGEKRSAGGITLGNIRHGVAQSGHRLLDRRCYSGRGLMTDAVKVLVRFAFDTLPRLLPDQATCIPDWLSVNPRLEKAGLEARKGLLRSLGDQRHLATTTSTPDVADVRHGTTTEGLNDETPAETGRCSPLSSRQSMRFARPSAFAAEPIKITCDDVAGSVRRVEIYVFRARAQVSTAPGPDGIVRHRR